MTDVSLIEVKLSTNQTYILEKFAITKQIYVLLKNGVEKQNVLI
jgi:hypothetical protein